MLPKGQASQCVYIYIEKEGERATENCSGTEGEGITYLWTRREKEEAYSVSCVWAGLRGPDGDLSLLSPPSYHPTDNMPPLSLFLSEHPHCLLLHPKVK